MTSLGIICARHHSSFKGKNWALVNGTPLIQRSVWTAHLSVLTRVIVSTDSAMVACLAKEFGADVPFKRPAKLATDDCRIEEAVRHGVEFCEQEQGIKYDIIVLLQNSSPMRLAVDINECLSLIEQGYTSALTVVEAGHKQPMKCLFDDEVAKYKGIDLHFDLKKEFYLRQQMPKAYYPNGLVYAVKRDYFMETDDLRSTDFGMVVVPEYRSIDIHDEWDLCMADAILKKMEQDNGIDG